MYIMAGLHDKSRHIGVKHIRLWHIHLSPLHDMLKLIKLFSLQIISTKMVLPEEEEDIVVCDCVLIIMSALQLMRQRRKHQSCWTKPWIARRRTYGAFWEEIFHKSSSSWYNSHNLWIWFLCKFKSSFSEGISFTNFSLFKACM